jgi:metal-sulfur cluster biosynthetic enzyme
MGCCWKGGSVISESDIRAALNTIVDPCSAVAGAPAGLQDMGLIRRVTIEEGEVGARVSVVIAVTEFGCLMGAPFVQEAYDRLLKLGGFEHIEVNLDDKFDWVASDMDPAYQARLDMHRRRPQRNVVPIKVQRT